jgi:hypothetical protein
LKRRLRRLQLRLEEAKIRKHVAGLEDQGVLFDLTVKGRIDIETSRTTSKRSRRQRRRTSSTWRRRRAR